MVAAAAASPAPAAAVESPPIRPMPPPAQGVYDYDAWRERSTEFDPSLRGAVKSFVVDVLLQAEIVLCGKESTLQKDCLRFRVVALETSVVVEVISEFDLFLHLVAEVPASGYEAIKAAQALDVDFAGFPFLLRDLFGRAKEQTATTIRVNMDSQTTGSLEAVANHAARRVVLVKLDLAQPEDDAPPGVAVVSFTRPPQKHTAFHR